VISRRFAGVLLAAALALGAGCGTEPDRKPQPPTLQPANDTPQNAMLRLVAAYEQKKLAEYRGLFTGDFRFEFSRADPTLVSRWPGGWSAADESIAARNLFQGGRNRYGNSLDAAIRIDLTLASTAPAGDQEGRDTTLYKELVTPVGLRVIVPLPPPSTNPLMYYVEADYHRLFLVRGDAAVGLASDQPADSAHWYVWRWKDECFSLPGPAMPAEVPSPVTWGTVKGTYR